MRWLFGGLRQFLIWFVGGYRHSSPELYQMIVCGRKNADKDQFKLLNEYYDEPKLKRHIGADFNRWGEITAFYVKKGHADEYKKEKGRATLKHTFR